MIHSPIVATRVLVSCSRRSSRRTCSGSMVARCSNIWAAWWCTAHCSAVKVARSRGTDRPAGARPQFPTKITAGRRLTAPNRFRLLAASRTPPPGREVEQRTAAAGARHRTIADAHNTGHPTWHHLWRSRPFPCVVWHQIVASCSACSPAAAAVASLGRAQAGLDVVDRYRRQQPFQGCLDVFFPGQCGAQFQA